MEARWKWRWRPWSVSTRPRPHAACHCLAAPTVGGGRAWPGFETTCHSTAAAKVPLVWRAPEGPEGTGGLRDRPLRAKLACGDLAGGRARRRPEHPWGHKQSPRGTYLAHQAPPGIQRQHTAKGPKRRSASGPSHARASEAHRLSWMLRPGTASISSRV